MAGGTVPGQAGPGDAVFYDNQFAKMGDLGSDVLPRAPSSTVWTAGSTVTVSWGIRFSTLTFRTAAVQISKRFIYATLLICNCLFLLDHGGGYQYRLCPASANLTEECFQKIPLDFVRTGQALVWNNGTRYPINGK